MCRKANLSYWKIDCVGMGAGFQFCWTQSFLEAAESSTVAVLVPPEVEGFIAMLAYKVIYHL